MKNKQVLFIYDRREVLTLSLLVMTVAFFTFTLGVHYGKQAIPKAVSNGLEHTSSLSTTTDQIPNRQELTEQSKAAQQALEDTLNQELHDEIILTGIKLETRRQVNLPEKSKTANGGATSLRSPSSMKKHQQTEVGPPPQSPMKKKTSTESLTDDGASGFNDPNME